jgi:hypothetical protein
MEAQEGVLPVEDVESGMHEADFEAWMAEEQQRIFVLCMRLLRNRDEADSATQDLSDPLTCPKCAGHLRILSFIDNPCVIEKILRYLKLWEPHERPPPLRRSITLEPDADFLDWAATSRQFDAID